LFGPAKADYAYSDRMPAAVIWLIFALVLAGAEALTGDMSLLMLSGGALAAAGTTWLLGWPLWAEAAVFVVVLDRVARDEGQVKLDGQVWTARPLNDNDVYEPGDRVTVMQINGATAVVFKDI
jgi:membrane protein implicated in regulation of membrane protease activity